jgi:hypothetical protein
MATKSKGRKKFTKETLINEILQQCKANDVPTTGDLFFSLAFLTESQLVDVCSKLNINIK